MPTLNSKKFRIGASHTVGLYILPGEPITTIQKQIDKLIKLDIAPCAEIIKAVKSRKIDLGFIEHEVDDVALSCQEWIEDELVICSKKQLPSPIIKEDISSYKLLCGELESMDRTLIDTFFREQDVHRDDFHSMVELNNPTAIIQNIKWSNINDPVTSIAFVSKVAIEHELKHNNLYFALVNNMPLFKKFHIIYRKDSEHIEDIKTIYKALLTKNKN